ncbi:MAG: RecQ family ATP-dependent DNA helicase [Actinobacteria bacterium]|nr:RecQ family ATP-dependent DNA helicase [Actinomycetota bacterium]
MCVRQPTGVPTLEKQARTSLAEARTVLADRFGYDAFLEGQEEALSSVFAGRNLLVVMPTGSGKSLIYQLPAVLEQGLTIVVSPLISLMKDQVDELLRIGIPATAVNSSLDRAEQGARLAACARGEVKLLYIAPERCRDPGFLARLERIEVARLAVDEAHCISEWGHDFRPDYRRLAAFREHIGCPPTTALTATATARVRSDIVASLGLDAAATDVHVHGFDRPNLVLSVYPAANDSKKIAYLSWFLMKHKGSGIIYAGTRKTTEEIVNQLNDRESPIVAYHAGMEPDARVRAQEAFQSGRARVVVATSAFGMGIDKPDVRFVVHYNYPGLVEQYYQEIGRAGRDGFDSECVLLYSSSDKGLREFFIKLAYPDRKQVESVWNTLCGLDENPVLMTHKEIAGVCDERVNEGQVGSAIRMLQDAGVVKAFEGEPGIAVSLDRPYGEIRPSVRGVLQTKVMEALASSFDMEEPGRFEMSLNRLATDAGISVEQARRALAALRDSGVVSYEAPFRGRGIEKLADESASFDSIDVDWKRHAMMRGLEEEKLHAMERYIDGRGCRRGYILRYFGERQSFRCDVCDNCLTHPSGTMSGGGVMEQEPDVALAVLACVRFCRFPIGKGRTADVVTGSKNKQVLEWKLDRNPAYGLVDRKTTHVKNVIESLIVEGYLRTSWESEYPVLVLTESGREAIKEVNGTGLKERYRSEKVKAQGEGVSARPGIARRGRSAGESCSSDAEVESTVLECVDELPYAVGITKLAAVLTGSRAAWISQAGVDQLRTYGTIDATQEQVRKIIRPMVDKGLLKTAGSKQMPTLKLTREGRAELDSR